jgi:hypothetical protein
MKAVGVFPESAEVTIIERELPAPCAARASGM